MSMDSTPELVRVADYLARQDDVRAAWLFGSMAEGRQRMSSDLDLAILGEREFGPERRLALIEALAGITGRPVDLVDLLVAGLPVARSAVLGGKLVYRGEREAYAEFLSRLLVDSADFLPYRERALKARREAWLQ